MLAFEGNQCFHAEARMYMARAVPYCHLTAGHLADVLSEVMIRPEQDRLILGQRLHDLQGVRRGDHDVCQCLDISRGVDVGYHFVSRVRIFPRTQVGGLAAVGKRTAGIHVRDQHFLLRAEDLCCLGHKMYTAQYDDLGIRLCGLLGEG